MNNIIIVIVSRDKMSNLFDQCDDHIMRLIAAQLGCDMISLQHLRATCARWRELIVAPKDQLSFCEEMQDIIRDRECDFDVLVVPNLRQIMSDANCAPMRAYLREIRDSLVEYAWNTCYNSHIFRSLIDILYVPDEHVTLTVTVSRRAISWPDLDNIMNLISDRNYGRRVDIDAIANAIEDAWIYGHLIQQIRDMMIAQGFDARDNVTHTYLAQTLVCRRIWLRNGVGDNLRQILITHFSGYIVDLVRAQDIARYINVEPDRPIELINCSGSILYYILRDICDQNYAPNDEIITSLLRALQEKFGADYWRNVAYHLNPLKIHPMIRAKISEICEEPFEPLLRRMYEYYISKGNAANWNHMCFVIPCADDRAKLLRHFRSYWRYFIFTHGVNTIMKLLMYEFDPTIIMETFNEMGMTIAHARLIVTQIAEKNAIISHNGRQLLALFAQYVVQKEQRERTVTDAQIDATRRNHVLRELYYKYGYIAAD